MKEMKVSNQKMKLGHWGEALAEKFLRERAVNVFARNVRSKFGELDLIGTLEGQTVFFEVKTRRTEAYGYPEDAISKAKSQHLRTAAEAYIQDHPDLPAEWRIDVVAIRLVNGKEPEIEWFENAVS
jgi:putative endonuclease